MTRTLGDTEEPVTGGTYRVTVNGEPVSGWFTARADRRRYLEPGMVEEVRGALRGGATMLELEARVPKSTLYRWRRQGLLSTTTGGL